MRAVTEGIPKEVRVTFQDFVLEGERLRLQGEATSFEAVDKIKAELQKAGLFAFEAYMTKAKLFDGKPVG